MHQSLVYLLVVVSLAYGALAHGDPIAPQWIWTGEERNAKQVVFLRKTIPIHKSVKSAHLVAAADFNRMTLYCNGQAVAVAEDYGPRVRIAVTEAVGAGDNVIAVECLASEGPSAAAVRLELIFEDGSQRTIVSDSTWTTSSSRQSGWHRPDFTANGWQSAIELGAVNNIVFGDPKSAIQIDASDDYTQWKQALSTESSSNVSTFQVPTDFQIDLIRSAREGEGSWVSMAFDPAGRVLLARESKGILRLTLDDTEQHVELVNDTLEECRGLLFAHDYLFANANNSKGLYRLRYSSEDDAFHDIKLLHHSPGGVGHGRNDLALGQDGMIYSIHGDSVDLPSSMLDRTSPFREHRRGIASKEGAVIRMDHNGEQKELVAAGLRNPFGIDFNEDGEMFTYDADAEFDMGAPWYRPTRVHHILPGGDYGWRGVTKQWPPYFPDHPDAAPPNLDIGKGSPTSVQFGTKSNFPAQFQRALYVLDWAYGRIVAVHTMPRGASYVCRAETFARGRPMNVTDLTFGPDGALYFVTGGRGTQSGLYRISYNGTAKTATVATQQQLAREKHAAAQRAIRHKLESYHGKQDADAVATAWPYLDSADPWLLHAARLAIEHQPIENWANRALAETNTTASLTALMSLAASGESRLQPTILSALSKFALNELSTRQKLTALRAYELSFERSGIPSGSILASIGMQLDASYPDLNWPVNRELSRLLAKLDTPTFVEKTMDLLDKAVEQAEQLHYLFVLRNVRNGWTLELRKRYFRSFALTEAFVAGEGMDGFIMQIKDDALKSLSGQLRDEAKAILAEHQSLSNEYEFEQGRPFVRDWDVEELRDSLTDNNVRRDLERGERAFVAAMCVRCHRMGSQGRSIGPDLTSVSSRFSRVDLLESIINPSKVVAEHYRKDIIETKDGRVHVGGIITSGDYRSPTLKILTNPLAPGEVIEIQKNEIVSHTKSTVSLMPDALLNTLTRDEILDLLSFIESGGVSAKSSIKP